MDAIASVKFYLNKMVEECGLGLKVLLMDKETVRFLDDMYLKCLTKYVITDKLCQFSLFAVRNASKRGLSL